MSVNGQTIIQWFEQFSPKHLALEGDKIGLQVGRLDKQVTKVMITLDVTEEVVEEAVAEQVDLLIAHHPIIYRPLQHIRTDLSTGRILEPLIKHDIAVYVAHTNLDVTEGGVNDLLANQLELEEIDILSTTYIENLKKLVVYVPKTDEQKVREALGLSGAGSIGKYSHCTFRTEGIGTFVPGENSKPYLGQQGKMEQVEEIKIETIFAENKQNQVIAALYQAHPYEEVAYDIYPVDQQGDAMGLGRVGKLKREMTLQQFAQYVKKVFDVSSCRVIGNLDAKVKKVAILGGDGNKYMNAAVFKGADVFVTGDVYFHTAHEALHNGLHVVDPGHHIEKVMIKGVQQVLQKAATDHKQTLEVIASNVNTEPFTFI